MPNITPIVGRSVPVPVTSESLNNNFDFSTPLATATALNHNNSPEGQPTVGDLPSVSPQVAEVAPEAIAGSGFSEPSNAPLGQQPISDFSPLPSEEWVRNDNLEFTISSLRGLGEIAEGSILRLLENNNVINDGRYDRIGFAISIYNPTDGSERLIQTSIQDLHQYGPMMGGVNAGVTFEPVTDRALRIEFLNEMNSDRHEDYQIASKPQMTLEESEFVQYYDAMRLGEVIDALLAEGVVGISDNISMISGMAGSHLKLEILNHDRNEVTTATYYYFNKDKPIIDTLHIETKAPTKNDQNRFQNELKFTLAELYSVVNNGATVDTLSPGLGAAGNIGGAIIDSVELPGISLINDSDDNPPPMG